MTRVREGKHLVNGRKFEQVRPALTKQTNAMEGVLDQEIPHERIVTYTEEWGRDFGSCGFDDEDGAGVEEDGQADPALHGPFCGPPEEHDEECEPPW